MRTFGLAATLLAVSLTCLRAGDGDDLSAGANAAKGFSFDGNKIGTSLTAFKKRYPKPYEPKALSQPKVGLVVLAVESEDCGYCAYHFLDAKLYQIYISYNNNELQKLGGEAVVTKKLFTKFGKPSSHSRYKEEGYESALWVFPQVQRSAYVRIDAKGVQFDVTDTKLENELKARRKKLVKPSFDD